MFGLEGLIWAHFSVVSVSCTSSMIIDTSLKRKFDYFQIHNFKSWSAKVISDFVKSGENELGADFSIIIRISYRSVAFS